MSSGPTTYVVKQVSYAGIGWGTAALCSTGAVLFWPTWSAFALILFAVICAYYTVWNIDLVYVLSEQGILRSSRWGAQRNIRWGDISRMKYFNRGMYLVLALKGGGRITIRYGEPQDTEAFKKDTDRLAAIAGVRLVEQR